MNLVFKLGQRFRKTVELCDVQGNLLGAVETDDDLFAAFYGMLAKYQINLGQLLDIRVDSCAESSATSVKAAYALANALSFALGLKKVEELSYPPRPAEFYPREEQF